MGNAQPLPWLLYKHHQFRSLSFAAVLVAVALHLYGKPVHPALWVYLGLQLLVYPHVMLAMARRAPHPIAREMQHLSVDAFALGFCAAVLGLPAWPSFAMAMATTFNSAFNKGWRGSASAGLAFALGAGIWMWLGAWEWQPHTDWPATVFCMVGLLVYVLSLGDVAHIRIGQLRRTRQDREETARALQEANEALRQQLAQINRLQDQLREQAHRDPLTGQYNRRYFDTTLQRELLRCQRDGAPLSVLMVDIDHFKTVNDTHGHPVGDEVLRQVGLLLASHARAHDVVCRYGGEEFVLMLPQLPPTQALQRAEQLRSAVQNHGFVTERGTLHITLSVGVASFPQHGRTPEALLHQADQALYQAKHNGRNQVQQASSTQAPAP